MEHKMGGMLRKEKKAKTGPKSSEQVFSDDRKISDAYEDVGVKRDAAYRYEVMSHCKTKVMEGYFAECRANGESAKGSADRGPALSRGEGRRRPNGRGGPFARGPPQAVGCLQYARVSQKQLEIKTIIQSFFINFSSFCCTFPDYYRSVAAI